MSARRVSGQGRLLPNDAPGAPKAAGNGTVLLPICAPVHICPGYAGLQLQLDVSKLGSGRVCKAGPQASQKSDGFRN